MYSTNKRRKCKSYVKFYLVGNFSTKPPYPLQFPATCAPVLQGIRVYKSKFSYSLVFNLSTEKYHICKF